MRLILVLSVFCSVFLSSCNNTKAEKTMEEPVNMVGGDSDKHGCKGSAGYVWSELRGECIRIFAEGITLLPLNIEESEAVYAVFVLYSEDKSQVELYLPSERESFLLQKQGENYSLNNYTYNSAKQSLYIDGELAYQAEAEY